MAPHGYTREEMTITARLLAKYAEILALRRARSVDPPIARLRALSETFPGSLRELDALGDDEVERRLALLRAADGKSAPEAWMVGMHWFHVELGALLRAKRWLGTRRNVDAALTEAFVSAHAGDDAALHWQTELAAIARPPGGKLSRLALAAAAKRASLEPKELRRWLG